MTFRDKVLDALAAAPGSNVDDLGAIIGISRSTAQRIVRDLFAEGKIARERAGTFERYRYFLIEVKATFSFRVPPPSAYLKGKVK